MPMSINSIRSLSITNSRLAPPSSEGSVLPHSKGIRFAKSRRARVLSLSPQWLVLGSDDPVVDDAVAKVEKALQSASPPPTITTLTHQSCSTEDLSKVWSGVIVTQPSELTEHQSRRLIQLRLQGVPICDLPGFYEAFYLKLPSVYLTPAWFALNFNLALVSNGLVQHLKRLVDLLASISLLVATAPIMFIAATLIKLDSPGSIFYSQIRTGLNQVPFRVYKFRSMREDAETLGAQWAQEGDSRITRVGRWMRSTRIDELPQLWNVLRGDMSLIGPRPERPEFDAQLAQTIPHYQLRYCVKPGITGWAQVMYPYGASVEDAYEKVAYDLYYIKNYSIWLDVAIAVRTVQVILQGKGR